jgi:hypothetical protein
MLEVSRNCLTSILSCLALPHVLQPCFAVGKIRDLQQRDILLLRQGTRGQCNMLSHHTLPHLHTCTTYCYEDFHGCLIVDTQANISITIGDSQPKGWLSVQVLNGVCDKLWLVWLVNCCIGLVVDLLSSLGYPSLCCRFHNCGVAPLAKKHGRPDVLCASFRKPQ